MKKIKWVLIAIWILTNSMTVYADTPDYILGREMSESEILKQQQYEPDRDTYISEGELKAVPVADNGLSRLSVCRLHMMPEKKALKQKLRIRIISQKVTVPAGALRPVQ